MAELIIVNYGLGIRRGKRKINHRTPLRQVYGLEIRGWAFKDSHAGSNPASATKYQKMNKEHNHVFISDEKGYFKTCECGEVKMIDTGIDTPLIKKLSHIAIEEAEKWFPERTVQDRLDKFNDEVSEFHYAIHYETEEEIKDELGDVVFTAIHTAYRKLEKPVDLGEVLAGAILKLKRRTVTGKYQK